MMGSAMEAHRKLFVFVNVMFTVKQSSIHARGTKKKEKKKEKEREVRCK